ncbi:ABC transporter, ATP-binding protein [Streptococcus sp. DD12]|nr:ABC transporter, ATP-binding protein [Streptococcus sp. DD12]
MTNVQEICDDLLMIRDGDIVLNGSIQEVRNHFGKTRILTSSQKSQEQLEALPHVEAADLQKDGNWLLKIDDEAAGPALFDALTEGQYVTTFVQEAPSLDEIFKWIAQGGDKA